MEKIIKQMSKDLKDLMEFVKESVVTKTELRETEQRLHDKIVGKVGGLNRRIDYEVDQRKQIEVRVAKLEHAR